MLLRLFTIGELVDLLDHYNPGQLEVDAGAGAELRVGPGHRAKNYVALERLAPGRMIQFKTCGATGSTRTIVKRTDGCLLQLVYFQQWENPAAEQGESR